MYSKTTNDITVTVEPAYLEDQSSPDEDHFVWSYHITIRNEGKDHIQLLSRHWQITDANGLMQEVRGEGVVGEQPHLAPGESYEYTSGAPLATPGGIMVGTFEMENNAGQAFLVDVPAFSLDSPYQKSVVN